MKNRHLISTLCGLVLFALTVNLAVSATLRTVPAPSRELRDQLIAVLQSDASFAEKSAACRQLAVIGGREAVPALAALLGDEKLNHMARYGLETIPHASVDTAFRKALEQLQGTPLVGVITSIGVRRDTKAVPALTRLLGSPDVEVAQAAARTLGSIGNAKAARALLAAWETSSEALKPALAEGLLRSAELLATGGERRLVEQIYGRMRATYNPAHVQAAGIAGGMALGGPDSLAILQQSLRGESYPNFAAAIQAAADVPGSHVTEVLATEFPGLATDRKVVVLQALGQRRDRSALHTVASAAQEHDTSVRVEALRSLGMLGDFTTVPILLDAAVWPDGETAAVAQAALVILKGTGVDRVLLLRMRGGDFALRKAAIRALGQRGSVEAAADLLELATSPAPELRESALRALGEIIRPSHLPRMTALLMKPPSPEDGAAVEAALTRALARWQQPAASSQVLLGQWMGASVTAREALLRLLNHLGDERSLAGTRAALNDAEPSVRRAALESLATWPNLTAAPVLLELTRHTLNPEQRAAAFRGYVQLVRESAAPADDKFSRLQLVAELAADERDRRLLLTALGEVPTLASLQLVARYLGDAGLGEAAGTAAVKIGAKLAKSNKAEVETVLNEVVKTASSTTVKEQAEKQLRELAQPR